MKNFIALVVAVTTSGGCAGPMARKVTVVDENGSPIRGAVTAPQPINAAPKESDNEGRMYVYGSKPEDTFLIIGHGFKDEVFLYGDKRTTFSLESVSKAKETDADEVARRKFLTPPESSE